MEAKYYLNTKVVFKRIDSMEEELELLKRDFIQSLGLSTKKEKLSLYGSIKAEDVPLEVIEKAKQSLFRNLEDI